MKHFELICAALLVGAVACQKEVVSEQEPQGPVTTSIMAGIDLTKTSVNNVSGKVTWAEGDQINVKCGDVYATFVLDPEYAGKSTGKFVTMDQISFKEGDEITAVYPASVMNTSDGTLTWPSEQTYAENAGCPMYVTGTVAEEGVAPELTFKNLGSILSFNIKTGDANMKVTRIEVESTDAIAGTFSVTGDQAVLSGDVKKITLNCNSGVSISSALKAFNVAIPANVSGEDYENVTIKVFANNRQIYFSTPKTLTLERNTVYNVNPTLEEPSNCYILAPGEKVVIRYMGQSEVKDWSGWRTLKDGSVASAEMLWKSVNTSEDPADKEIVKSIAYDNATGLLTVEAGSVEGNEVVGVFDESGTILWSYHIWVASSVGDVSFAGSTLMDRCLGVVKQPVYGATEVENAGSYGLLYQRFRKDPIMSFDMPGSNTPAAVMKKENMEFNTYVNLNTGTTIEGMSVVDYLTTHPTVRVAYSSADFDVTSLRGRWSKEKGIQDPCPKGYRVPAQSDLIECTEKTNETLNSVVRDKLNQNFIGAGGKYYNTIGDIQGSSYFNFETFTSSSEYYCYNVSSGGSSGWSTKSTANIANYYQIRCVKITD